VRIVHIVHQYPPEFRGGTEAYVESMSAEQRARGDEVLVIAGSDERDDRGVVRHERVGGTKLARVLRRPGENYSMDWRRPRVAEQVVGLVQEFRPDIVHLHEALNLSGDIASRLTAAGYPVVATLHDFTLVCARFFLVRPDGESCEHAFPLPSERCVACVLPDFPEGEAALRRETAARAETARAEAAAIRIAIAPSEAVRTRWRRSGLYPESKLVLLGHPVRPAPAAPAPPRSRADGRLVLVTWGHLAPAKGVLDLLAAVRLARDPRIALIILGEPVTAEHAEELLDAAEGLDVTFRGRYADKDLATLRGEADLAVFASRAEETFSLVVAEARAMGFPVVVSDRGALPERVGGGGAVVPAGDPATLAHLFAALLSDPAPLREWAAVPPIRLPTPAEYAAQLADLYDRALRA
jgi:glycosyltransferase involved in cell wall biosynthesis